MAYQPKSYRKFLAGSVSAAVVASALAAPAGAAAAAASFPDVPTGHWAYNEITTLADKGIINGYSDGSFKPSQLLNRGQAAVLFTNALGLDVPENLNVFKDLKATSYFAQYAAAVEANGVFGGYADGNFGAGDNLTREQMASVLVRAFDFKDTGAAVDLTDLDAAHASHRENIKILTQNGISVNADKTFDPKEPVSRAHFATFLYRSMLATGMLNENPDVVSVTAINSTTVEVKMAGPVEDVEASDFTIDGLTVSNAAVKQTDANTVVLTTSAQEGKEYTLKIKGETAGKFTGVSSVVPTDVEVVAASQQGVIGKEVTVSATVAVADGQSKAGIPVTFNITNSSTNNDKVEVEAFTDENGVAEYSYTRYYNGVDTVVAYSTSKSSINDTAKVYWASALQLEIEEVTQGNDLANNTKKAYKVSGAANTSYYVAIKENLNVAPNKLTEVSVLDRYGRWENPYTLTTGAENVVEIRTDSKGEATFSLFAEDATVTPIVYSATNADFTYSATDLQAAGNPVKFSLQNVLQLSIAAEGVQKAAEYSVNPATVNPDATGLGGRNYTVTVKDKNGNLATKGTQAYVTFENGNIKNPGSVYVVSGDSIYTSSYNNGIIPITVGEDGEATFRILGNGETTFAVPTVFLNTAGTIAPALDKTDVQLVGEATYFTDASVRSAELTVTNDDDKETSSFVVGKEATVTYQSVDQNGFPYSPGVNYDLTFDVSSTFGNVEVKDVNGTVLVAEQNLGTVKTYKVTADSTGKAVIKLDAKGQGTVSVNVSGANNILPIKAATVTFTGEASTLDQVNAATTAQAVLDGLLDSSSYRTKLANLPTADQLSIATQVLAKRPGAGYSETQLATTFNSEYNRVAGLLVYGSAAYTKSVGNVSAVAASGTYDIATGDSLEIEGTTAAGANYNGWDVEFVDTDKDNLTIVTDVDTTNKVVTVDLANTSVVDDTVASTFSEVETAIEAITELPLVATLTFDAASSNSGSTVASSLVGETITLDNGVTGVTASPAKVVLSFTEAVKISDQSAGTAGDQITLDGVTGTASVSPDKKTVTVVFAADPNLTAADTIDAITGLVADDATKTVVYPIDVTVE